MKDRLWMLMMTLQLLLFVQSTVLSFVLGVKNIEKNGVSWYNARSVSG